MKITKTQLKQIIKEELENTLSEVDFLKNVGKAAASALTFDKDRTSAWARQAAAGMGHGKSQKGIEVLEAVMRIGNTLEQASRRYYRKLDYDASEEDQQAHAKGHTIEALFAEIKNVPQLMKDIEMLDDLMDGPSDQVTEAVLIIANQARNLVRKLESARRSGIGTDISFDALHRGVADLIEEFEGIAYEAEILLSGTLGQDPLAPSTKRGQAYTESRKRRSTQRRRR